ncbi:hypothetical protein [Streptomyces sp. 6N223]
MRMRYGYGYGYGLGFCARRGMGADIEPVRAVQVNEASEGVPAAMAAAGL